MAKAEEVKTQEPETKEVIVFNGFNEVYLDKIKDNTPIYFDDGEKFYDISNLFHKLVEFYAYKGPEPYFDSNFEEYQTTVRKIVKQYISGKGLTILKYPYHDVVNNADRIWMSQANIVYAEMPYDSGYYIYRSLNGYWDKCDENSIKKDFIELEKKSVVIDAVRVWVVEEAAGLRLAKSISTGESLTGSTIYIKWMEKDAIEVKRIDVVKEDGKYTFPLKYYGVDIGSGKVELHNIKRLDCIMEEVTKLVDWATFITDDLISPTKEARYLAKIKVMKAVEDRKICRLWLSAFSKCDIQYVSLGGEMMAYAKVGEKFWIRDNDAWYLSPSNLF